MSLVSRKVAFGDTVHPNLHRTIKSCHADLMNLSVYPGTWYGEIPVGKYVRLSVILRLHAHEPEDEFYYTGALEDYIAMIESCRLTYFAPYSELVAICQKSIKFFTEVDKLHDLLTQANDLAVLLDIATAIDPEVYRTLTTSLRNALELFSTETRFRCVNMMKMRSRLRHFYKNLKLVSDSLKTPNENVTRLVELSDSILTSSDIVYNTSWNKQS